MSTSANGQTVGSAPAAPRHGLRLFDDFVRTDHGPATRLEEGFPWWNRSARPEIAQMRDVVESWFARYAPEDAARLRREFRSKRKPQHVGALFELFIHEHLCRAGFEVRCQVDLRGTPNKPDFLALSDGRPVFYVEAKTKLDSERDAKAERLRQEIMEVIRHLRSADYLVGVTHYGSLEQSVNKRVLKQELLAWLTGLDHQAEVERFRLNPYARHAGYTWKAGGLTLEFHAMPRTDSRGSDFGTFLASESQGKSRLLRTDVTIAGAVEEKASRYGDLDLPYLIAINLMDFTTDEDDVSQGLGVAWGTPEAPTRQGVSGVLLAFVPNMAGAVKFTPLLVTNPMATRPLDGHAGVFHAFRGTLQVLADAPLP